MENLDLDNNLYENRISLSTYSVSRNSFEKSVTDSITISNNNFALLSFSVKLFDLINIPSKANLKFYYSVSSGGSINNFDYSLKIYKCSSDGEEIELINKPIKYGFNSNGFYAEIDLIDFILEDNSFNVYFKIDKDCTSNVILSSFNLDYDFFNTNKLTKEQGDPIELSFDSIKMNAYTNLAFCFPKFSYCLCDYKNNKFDYSLLLNWSRSNSNISTVNGMATGLPKGFFLNVHKFIKFENNKVIYTNELGESLTFTKLNSQDVYLEDTGLRLIIRKINVFFSELIDTDGNIYVFNRYGLLSEIKVKTIMAYHSVHITYGVRNARVNRIYDNGLIDVSFNYSTTSNSLTINFGNYKNSVNLSMDQYGFLSSIGEFGGDTSYVQYVSNANLQLFRNCPLIDSITNNRTKIMFSYDDYYRLVEITESDAYDNIYNKTSFKNGFYNTFVASKKYNSEDLKTVKRFSFNSSKKLIYQSDIEDNVDYNGIYLYSSSNKDETLSKGNVVSRIHNFSLTNNSINRDIICKLGKDNTYLICFEIDVTNIRLSRNSQNIIRVSLLLEDDGSFTHQASIDIPLEEVLNQKNFAFSYICKENFDQNDENIDQLTRKLVFAVSKTNFNGNVNIKNITISDFSSSKSYQYYSNINSDSASIPNDYFDEFYLISNPFTITYRNADVSYMSVISLDATYKDIYYSFIISKLLGINVLFYNDGCGLLYNIINPKIETIYEDTQTYLTNFFNIHLAAISSIEYGPEISFAVANILKYENDLFVKQISEKKRLNNDVMTQNEFSFSDNYGNVVKTIGKDGIQTIYDYDFYNLNLLITKSKNNKISRSLLCFDSLLNVINEVEHLENTSIETCYSYNSKNLLEAESIPTGFTKRYSYYSDRKLNTISFDGQNTSYTSYNNDLISYINDDRYVNTNRFRYSFVYDNFNRLISVMLDDHEIKNVVYSYNERGYEVVESSISGHTLYTYDKYGRLLSKVLPNDYSIQYYYRGNSLSTEKISHIITNDSNGSRYTNFYYENDVLKSIYNDYYMVEKEQTCDFSFGTFISTNINIYYDYSHSLIFTESQSNQVLRSGNSQKYREIAYPDTNPGGTIDITHDFIDSYFDNSYETISFSRGFYDSFFQKTIEHHCSENSDGSISLYNFIKKEVVRKRLSNTIFEANYQYDSCGKISGISNVFNNTLNQNISYIYDEKGQLVVESINGNETNFIYDNCGNILSKSNNSNTIYYTYDEDSHLLMSYGNYQFNYDDLGYPTLYKNQPTAFENYLLSNFGDISFKYDAFGRLSSIRNNNSLSTYIKYFDNKIMEFKRVINGVNHTLNFIYGIDNQIIGFKYNNNYYFVVRNILNDVVALLDSYMNSVAFYQYSSYGECKVFDNNFVQNTSPSFIGNLFPFRYRGYYYVNETDLYMMGHRYYDPEIGRFVSPDDVEYLDPTKINGLNLYAYCNNDPINYVDPSGHSAIALLIAVGVGALLGFIGGTANALIEDYNDNRGIDGSIGWQSYLGSMVGSTIGGAALGFAGGIGALWLGPAIAGTGSLATAFGGVALSTGVSFAGGFLNYSADRWISGEKWKLESALLCGGLTAIEGLVAYGAGGVSSLVNWEGGKIIKLGKYSINIQETIAQNFVSDIFGNPTGWLLDIIMGYYG